MKLYFMIGLPTEEEEDVRAIPQVGGRARATGKRVKKATGAPGTPNVTVSVSTHVPKPHTPFQWCAMDAPETVREKQRWLKEEARAARVDLRTHDCDTSWLEGVFARGDRSLAPVLERAYRAGARFDSWEDQKNMAVWEEAFRAEGVSQARYLGTIPATARLPWDHIDVGLEDGFLLREYRKALKDRLSLPCGKVAGAFVHATNLRDAGTEDRKLVCYDCGIACDLGAMREQRLVYLRKLGADEPRPAPAAPPPRRGKAPPLRPDQGHARRYRFVYEKLGPAAFLSHLDLIRALPRAFRRLDLPLFYSQGFHPKPDMTFGPALSLGVASLCEVVDVKITAEVDPSELLSRLSEGSHAGLRFVGGVPLGANDAAVSKIVDAASYVVGIPRSAIGASGEAGLRERVTQALASPELAVIRRIDGIGKRINVKEFLLAIEVGQGAEALSSAGVVGELVPVSIRVEVRGSGGVKVSEVVEAIFGDPELPHRSVRTALGARLSAGRVASPLELEAVRAHRSAREAELPAFESSAASPPSSQRPFGPLDRLAVGEKAPS
jgi:radical SAM-linked protein